jgi:hypothetical protein
MALDGYGNFTRTYDGTTSESREVKYGPKEAETLETYLVVMLYAKPTGFFGNA